MVASRHSTYSLLRENIVEHLLIGGLMREYWKRNIYDVEILRSEFDANGYDLVLTYDDLTRHIQLKSAKNKFSYYAISEKLFQRPSACVVVSLMDDNLENIKYFWYGSDAGDQMKQFPEPKRNKGISLQKKRPHYPVIENEHFCGPLDMPTLAARLIGKPKALVK